MVSIEPGPEVIAAMPGTFFGGWLGTHPASPQSLVGTALVSAAACAAILAGLLTTGLAWRLALDRPNERSLHVVPTPRCGGWGIVPCAVLVLFIDLAVFWPLIVGALALAAVSYLDDRGGLPARVRFTVHAAAAALVLAFAKPALSPALFVAIAFLSVWSINLFNFMDGADGLAGCMTVVGFSAYSVAAAANADGGDAAIAFAAAATAGAGAGFLAFNLPPARVFLGDVGSVPLGFLAAAFGFLGWRNGTWPMWFPFMAFSPFFADASVTLIKRLARREKVWQAHREHYYQRLIRSGASHAHTTALYAAFMLAGAGLALYLRVQDWPTQIGGIAFWALALCAAGWTIDRRWARFNRQKA